MKLKAFDSISIEEKFVGYENEKYIVLTDGYELNDDEFLNLSIDRIELDSGESYKIFEKETGKCINDLFCSMFGSTTYIDPIK